MNGSDFLDFASLLAASQTAPPACRTAASRAYYGVYHLATALLNDNFKFFCPRGENGHQWVREHFYNCTSSDAHEVGLLLGNLHESRKDADYALEKDFPDRQSHAITCVERADRVRDMIRKFDTAQVRIEMESYRTKRGYP